MLGTRNGCWGQGTSDVSTGLRNSLDRWLTKGYNMNLASQNIEQIVFSAFLVLEIGNAF